MDLVKDWGVNWYAYRRDYRLSHPISLVIHMPRACMHDDFELDVTLVGTIGLCCMPMSRACKCDVLAGSLIEYLLTSLWLLRMQDAHR